MKTINVNKLEEYSHKDECFAITTYCNTEEKVQTLNRTIENIKQYGLPIFVHAHYPLPYEIQKKIDFYFYSSDNPIFNRFNSYWYFINDYKLEFTWYDYYYTTVKGWNESIKILSDYERIHMINYDANIYPEIFNVSRCHDKSIFLQNENYTYNFFRTKSVYPPLTISNNNQVFLTYFCLNKKSFDFFRENITLKKYIGYRLISSSPFLPLLEEFVGYFLHGDDFYMVPHNEIDYNKILKYDAAADYRFHWNETNKLENTMIFIGEYDGIANVLFYAVEKPVEINILIFRKGFLIPGAIMGGEIGGKISLQTKFSLDLAFKDIEKIEIRVDNKLVNDDLIKKFFLLECKIYKE
jgi:hypothetical protein